VVALPSLRNLDGAAMIDWVPVVQRLGYASEDAMWKDLYDAQRLSIAALAQRLGVSRNTIRHTLERRGVTLRGRGGANNNALDLTDAVIEEVRQHGVMAVAKRLEINYTTLYKRLRARGLSVADLRKGEADGKVKPDIPGTGSNEPTDGNGPSNTD
jgi:transcriptional regulator of acetoin/glycerol metabolism